MSQIEVDQRVRFSKSVLWQAQRRYFEDLGVHAWNGAVPFYITSNPMIAQNYAKIIANYVLDLKHRGELDLTQPVYALELGTGSGQFSYLCLIHLLEMKMKLGIEDVKICYVMTDFTESNLRFWEDHELFKPYVQSGDLDFAVYDLEQTEQIELLHGKQVLQAGSVSNPLVVVANYIFDTVVHDIFNVNNGVLSESLLTLKAAQDNVQDGMPVTLENLDTEFTHQPISDHYYDNPLIDKVLNSFKSDLTSATFLFPIGTFVALDALNKISQNRTLVIATDKGYCDLAEIEGRGDPMIAFHGSVSMSVNFNAISKYFNELGGDSVFQAPREGIKSCVFVLGHKMNDLPLTQQAVDLHITGFGPSDFFAFHRHFRETSEFKINTILSHMHFSRWDPYIFSVFADKIIREVPNASLNIQRGFVAGVDRLIANTYPMPGAEDHYLNIGVLLHNLHQYEKALRLYELSLQHYGEKFPNVFNLGLCHYMIGEFKQALPYFELAKEMDAGDESARAEDWYQETMKQLKGDSE